MFDLNELIELRLDMNREEFIAWLHENWDNKEFQWVQMVHDLVMEKSKGAVE